MHFHDALVPNPSFPFLFTCRLDKSRASSSSHRRTLPPVPYVITKPHDFKYGFAAKNKATCAILLFSTSLLLCSYLPRAGYLYSFRPSPVLPMCPSTRTCFQATTCSRQRGADDHTHICFLQTTGDGVPRICAHQQIC